MQERVTLTIPTSNKWHTEDIEKKAEELGMAKGEFLIEAVNMMMCFDTVFLNKLSNQSEGLHMPLWLVMQNMIIKRMAEDAAKVETKTWKTQILTEFAYVGEGLDKRALTGEELFNMLKEQFICEIKIARIKENSTKQYVEEE